MKIKTLEFIHQLLLEEEDRTDLDYQVARKLQYEYEESESADRALLKRKKAEADEYMKLHMEAANALEDFETHEW